MRSQAFFLEPKMFPKWDPNRIFDAEALRKPLESLLDRSWRLLEPKKRSLGSLLAALGGLLGSYNNLLDPGNSPREANLTGSGPGGGGNRRGGTGKLARIPELQDCWTEIQLSLTAGCPWQAGAGGSMCENLLILKHTVLGHG